MHVRLDVCWCAHARELVCVHAMTCVYEQDLYKYDCLRANKATMAWGLEARVPFLDVEFVRALPDTLAARPWHPSGAQTRVQVSGASARVPPRAVHSSARAAVRGCLSRRRRSRGPCRSHPNAR